MKDETMQDYLKAETTITGMKLVQVFSMAMAIEANDKPELMLIAPLLKSMIHCVLVGLFSQDPRVREAVDKKLSEKLEKLGERHEDLRDLFKS